MVWGYVDVIQLVKIDLKGINNIQRVAGDLHSNPVPSSTVLASDSILATGNQSEWLSRISAR